MFDIGFQELLLISVLSLLIMGPERLPGAVRTATLWISRIRNSFQQLKTEIEREVGVDEIKQQIHNDAIMKSLEKIALSDQENHTENSNNSDELPYDITDIVSTPKQQHDSNNDNDNDKEPIANDDKTLPSVNHD